MLIGKLTSNACISFFFLEKLNNMQFNLDQAGWGFCNFCYCF